MTGTGAATAEVDDGAGAGPDGTTAGPRPSRALLVVGWVAVTALLIALVLVLIPVSNPGVQECGTPAAYLVRGRTDVYPDADGRVRRHDGSVETLTRAERARAASDPCSERVAHRAVPAGALALAGAVTAIVLLVIAWLRAWKRAGPRPRTAAPTAATSDAGPTTSG